MLAWLFGSATRAPVLLELRSSRTFIIATVSTATFTDLFIYGIIVPVLPFALTTRVAIQPDRVQTWISVLLAVYGAALLLASPFLGWIADRMSSRRVPMLAGLIALAGTTVMLCLGTSISVLVAARVLQGISGAVVWVVGLALLVDTVGPDEVGVAMGYLGLSLSLAFLLAPLLGGVVFAAAGYYAVFAMAFGLIGLDIFLRCAMIEKKVARRYLPNVEVVAEPSEKQPRHDEEKQVACDATHPGPQSEDPAVDPPHANLELEIESQMQAHLNTHEDVPMPQSVRQPAKKKLIHKLPPVLVLLSSRRLLASLCATVIQASLLTAFDSTLPLFVRNTFHFNSTGAGLIFLPLTVATFIGPLVGWASDKYGPRWLAAAGFLFGSPCIILLRLVQEDTLRQKVLMCALLALIGVALTFALTPILAEVAYAVDAKAKRHGPGLFGKNGAYAQAYSLFNVAWAAGSLIGPLLGGLINQAGGWKAATLVLGIVSAVATIPVAIWTGGSIFKRRRGEQEEAA